MRAQSLHCKQMAVTQANAITTISEQDCFQIRHTALTEIISLMHSRLFKSRGRPNIHGHYDESRSRTTRLEHECLTTGQMSLLTYTISQATTTSQHYGDHTLPSRIQHWQSPFEIYGKREHGTPRQTMRLCRPQAPAHLPMASRRSSPRSAAQETHWTRSATVVASFLSPELQSMFTVLSQYCQAARLACRRGLPNYRRHGQISISQCS